MPIPVHWAGFESDTLRMARGGWEWAVENDVFEWTIHRPTQVLSRNKEYGWTFSGQAHNLDRLADAHSAGLDPRNTAYIVMNHMVPDGKMFFDTFVPVIEMYSAVDMADMRPITRTELMTTGLFKKWVDPQEIIVRPEQVHELLAKITKLQEPELQQIRERNRLREYRQQTPETRHATVISIAA